MENEKVKPAEEPMGTMEKCGSCPAKPICKGDFCPEDDKDDTPAGRIAAEMREKFVPTLKAIDAYIEEKRKEFPDLKIGSMYDISIIDSEDVDHGFSGINTIGIMRQISATDVIQDRTGFLALAIKSVKAARDYFGRRGIPGMPPAGLMAALLGNILKDSPKEDKPDKPN